MWLCAICLECGCPGVVLHLASALGTIFFWHYAVLARLSADTVKPALNKTNQEILCSAMPITPRSSSTNGTNLTRKSGKKPKAQETATLTYVFDEKNAGLSIACKRPQ